jgi:hypothetical protein
VNCRFDARNRTALLLPLPLARVVQSCNGVTIAQRRRTRPELPVETELNGVDVLRVRPEGRYGLPIEPLSE